MLTQSQVRSLRPTGRVQKISDGGGLYLHITTAGTKSWRYNYRFNGKQKTLTLGQFPIVALEFARRMHHDARTLLAQGIDPGDQRKVCERTFQHVAQEWHKHWSPQKSPQHAAQVLRRLELDVFPVIGGYALVDLEASHFRGVAQAIEKRGAGEVARRNLNVCGQIMRYAIAHGYARRNPVADVRPGDILRPLKRRNYPRVTEAELPDLLRAIDGYVGVERTRLGLQLLALTFVRTSELIGAQWEEIDMDNARWRIPAERMKMRRDHIVPLSKQALAILYRLHQIAHAHESPWVLPNDIKPKALHMSNNTLLYALYRLGYRGRMCGHGFRGIASTILHESGFDHRHVELQLAHSDSDPIASAYNYAQHLPERTSMMQQWADYLDAARKRP